ncbi:RNA chaperone Hfq [Bacillus paranthracis]|uniref:RNA chaperone Hfq n=1 Tax=Bacillus paranthracis TaxID=2026186 RepID=UPI0018798EA2|nr:RNA chaperone Hfq [Bacillus paranthracis]MBE7117226.1 RNA chaperone Hfq [Bacillus paranthracis]MBE7134835.1 RNA chaperone Hfq [Bacillus paranthracis]
MKDIQNELYEQLKLAKKEITLFLISGVRMTGQIVGVDKFTILMIVNGKQQLIYKQAVSTIV